MQTCTATHKMFQKSQAMMLVLLPYLVRTAFSPAADRTAVRIESDRERPFKANHSSLFGALPSADRMFTPVQMNRNKGLNTMEPMGQGQIDKTPSICHSRQAKANAPKAIGN